jgi:hypothetical protein
MKFEVVVNSGIVNSIGINLLDEDGKIISEIHSVSKAMINRYMALYVFELENDKYYHIHYFEPSGNYISKKVWIFKDKILDFIPKKPEKNIIEQNNNNIVNEQIKSVFIPKKSKRK